MQIIQSCLVICIHLGSEENDLRNKLDRIVLVSVFSIQAIPGIIHTWQNVSHISCKLLQSRSKLKSHAAIRPLVHALKLFLMLQAKEIVVSTFLPRIRVRFNFQG